MPVLLPPPDKSMDDEVPQPHVGSFNLARPRFL